MLSNEISAPSGFCLPAIVDGYGHTPFKLYDLRHTFLTRLGEVNTDPFTIQRIAGHSSITMSQRYVHPTPERLEDAFARLETYNQAKIAAKPNTENVAVN